ncbi:protease [Streptococcus pyogenes]|uniref:hypothetical protein n=1 Tax=Streptococcus pyogenes TaxID=1314 RepID=UPI00109D0F7C|nr:hypothetical protein [Streptococcus pyogenes]QCK70794.1 hypothetical protein ETT46_04235 [Streptococcus pyogenes]VGR51221.1 protease [Streptococcus pyogenes]VGR84688.1 protease [Streptococcus pyogenes]VGS24020.1 protease [Streptococcus pyogenes]VGX00888.1 protease [Streptococcus pyogenes]
MKQLLAIILWLPKLIVKMFWHLIKGFLQTILLVTIIIIGLMYYSNHSDSVLANKISTVTEQVVQIFDTLTQKPSAKMHHQSDKRHPTFLASAQEDHR